MSTQTTTLENLREGDIVTAVDGKPRPFPYTVTMVVTHVVSKKNRSTHVRYAHGGFIPLAPATTPVTIQTRAGE